MSKPYTELIEAAVEPYRSEGRADLEFVRGKLRYDPVFPALLRRGLIPDGGRLLDIGCGLGALPALLLAARGQYEAGGWPSDWSPPPQNLELHGLELNPRKAAIAARALHGGATIVEGDVRSTELPECTVAVVLDVMLYLSAEDQLHALRRVAQAMRPGGMLIMREGDAAAGWRFHATRIAEKICCLGRGQGWYPLHYRATTEWVTILQELSFTVETLPMSEGTPFSNVLFRAIRR